jgi:hypothetical protein
MMEAAGRLNIFEQDAYWHIVSDYCNNLDDSTEESLKNFMNRVSSYLEGNMEFKQFLDEVNCKCAH